MLRDAPSALPRSSRNTLGAILALQDWMALTYLGIIGALVALSSGPAQPRVLLRITLCVGVIMGGAIVYRVALELPEIIRLNVYRLALGLTVVESYLMLRELLPLVRTDAVDSQLLALDLQLFGFEPALWLQRFNHLPVVEWFSFFYFSYFFICGAYLVGVMWCSGRNNRHTTVFAIGSLMVLFIGHLGYLVVPGYGPVAHLQQNFTAPIDGGFFWHCVEATVAAGGAQKDIFPSLHTALPTWFTLYAVYRAKHDPRWNKAALITGLFAANIIISTMFLRWHYAIDVIAGLALSISAFAAAPRLALLEARWRQRRGFGSPWSPGERARGASVQGEGLTGDSATSGKGLTGLSALEVELEPAGEG